MISDSIKEEDYPMPDEGILSPAGDELTVVMLSDNIKEEEEAYPMADQDPEEVKTFHRPAAEEFTIAMASDRIKEEGEDYPVAAENQGEVINVHIPFGEELSIATKSDDIKEEDTYPMVDQDPEEVKNIYSCANVLGPDAAESRKRGNDESQPQSDSNTSESIIQEPTRRRARVLPLHEFSPDSDELQDEVLRPPSEGRRPDRQQSLFQRQSTLLRRRREEGRQCTEEGEGPSLFGGLEASMLKVQRLQRKHMRSMNRQFVSIDHNMGSMHRQLVYLNNNMCRLHEGQQATAEHVREMRNAIKELCTVMQQEHVTHRRRHHQLMGRLDGFSRSVSQLTTTNALVSQSAVGMQMEMAHCSPDIARGLVQVTNVLETMQTARSAANSDLCGGDSEELASLCSFTAPVMDPRRHSSRHSTVSEPATRRATEPTKRSSGVRGRKK
ncbi:microtubule-associated protein futsch-like isoform X7 [Pleurodeles waltl]